MTTIWQTVLAIIGSVGGAGVIIGFVVKFASDVIADKLSQKYELKLNKELEKYKASLDKRTHISRARFDMEFSIYGKLSEAFLSMEQATYWLFPDGLDRVPLDEENREKVYTERYEKASEAIVNAEKTLGANAPFIPSEIYRSFDEIRMLCTRQYNMYTWCGPLAKQRNHSEVFLKQETECWERTKEIMEKKERLMNRLREYLENLDVVEGT